MEWDREGSIVIFEIQKGGAFLSAKARGSFLPRNSRQMSRRPKTMDKAIVHGSVAFYLGKKVQPKL